MARLPNSFKASFNVSRPRRVRLKELRDNLEAINDHIVLLRMKRNQIRQELLRIASDAEKTTIRADTSLDPI